MEDRMQTEKEADCLIEAMRLLLPLDNEPRWRILRALRQFFDEKPGHPLPPKLPEMNVKGNK